MVQTDFHSSATTTEYQQDDSNIFCFSGLSSELFTTGETVSKEDILGRIKESLVCQSQEYSDRIKISDGIIHDREQKRVIIISVMRLIHVI